MSDMLDLFEGNIIKHHFSDEGFGKIVFDIKDNFNYAFDVIDVIADKYPDKKALIWISENGEEKIFTFADIRKESSKIAHYLKSFGIKKGDKVLLVLRRNYQWWLIMIALCRLGAIAIPATEQLKEHDFIWRINAAKIKAMIITASSDVIDEADRSRKKCAVDLLISVNGSRVGWQNFEKYCSFPGVFSRNDNFYELKKDDLMLMYFTSGTTAYPKIVAHTQTYPLGHYFTAKYWQGVEKNGVHFTLAETGWAKAGWGKIFGQWLCGTCVFVYDFRRFKGDEILSLIEKYKITTFCAPATVFRMFEKEDITKYNFNSLKRLTSAGEPLDSKTFNIIKEKFGLSINEGFGQSETPVLIGNFVYVRTKNDSMGIPNPLFDIVLLDEEGKRISEPFKTGEICVNISKEHPFGLLKEYYGDKEQTSKAFLNGYYHTGDTAYFDDCGFYFYKGRVDDVIKSSGYRISPHEIETVLLQHPSVYECFVSGVPDEIRGKIIKATIVLKDGYSPSDDLKKSISVFMKSKTAPYKHPRIIEFVNALPRTFSGKVKRNSK